MLSLDTKITDLNRVGKTTASRLNRLGITEVRELLFYFPWRYEDFTKLTPIDKLKDGMQANIVGQIELIQNKKSWKKRMSITEALISDDTESIKVIWFNQPFIARNLHVGDKISLAGKVEDDYGGFIMKSPTYEKLGSEQAIHTQGLVPNYHLTTNLTNKQLRFLIKQVINLAKNIDDWLPSEIISNLKLPSLSQAINNIHFPKNKTEAEIARQRLAFNELFLLQLQSQIIKQELKNSQAQTISFQELKTKKFVDSLPFKLTDAQKKSAWEILQDLEKNKPMSRLLSGDVGSGKTIVAILALLNTALNNKQAVLMVPTEILAKQHFATITKLLKNFNIPIALITRSEKTIYSDSIKNKKINLASIINKAKIIIGTHALIQEKIKFNDLTLAIIDEQHRFGVAQRKTLLGHNKKLKPHLLSMTATPIPRSLALALYGDLDLSIINQMPKNRKKIITKVIPEVKRQEAYNFIKKQIKEGRQVFVICPLIDISDKLGVKSVKEEFTKLDKNIFPDLKIGILHGRMKAKDKEKTMQEFLDNKIKILVSTSVIEVGVDVPNAAIIMIEGADRFGLAQLHQFRGRVGRSNYQSYCFLFTESSAPKTMKRLQTLTDCHDGLTLAKEDLKFRGAGEVYGTAQKGFPELKIASLFDYKLMNQARDEAIKLLAKNPNLEKYPNIREKIEPNKEKIHLE